MMNSFFALALGVALVATPVFAQTVLIQSLAPTQRTGITEAEIEARVTAAGYSEVSAVQKQGDGWIAKARKDDRTVNVTIDPDGKVQTAGMMQPGQTAPGTPPAKAPSQ
jgi:hypothetical protein